MYSVCPGLCDPVRVGGCSEYLFYWRGCSSWCVEVAGHRLQASRGAGERLSDSTTIKQQPLPRKSPCIARIRASVTPYSRSTASGGPKRLRWYLVLSAAWAVASQLVDGADLSPGYFVTFVTPKPLNHAGLCRVVLTTEPMPKKCRNPGLCGPVVRSLETQKNLGFSVPAWALNRPCNTARSNIA